MRFTRVTLVLICLLLNLPLAAAAASSAAPDVGVTQHADVVIPARPITSQAQLDAYVHDTPSSRSPLNWLTPPARKRFLSSLVFHDSGLSGLYLGDVSYELTGEQAYALLRLFGAQSYALSLDARNTSRPRDASAEASTLETGYTELVATADQPNHAQAIAQAYAQRFSAMQTGAQRRALSGRDAELLFRAAALVFRVTQRPSYVNDMRADFSELQRRDLVDRPYASDLFDALIVIGNTTGARALRATYPLIERGSVATM